jgi:hypothetical protein
MTYALTVFIAYCVGAITGYKIGKTESEEKIDFLDDHVDLLSFPYEKRKSI